MGKIHDCSLHSDKLHCSHSSETLLLLLSRSLWPLTIKEISELSGLHRNTIRGTLKGLMGTKIKAIGVKKEGENTKNTKIDQYYYSGINDFYRSIAVAIEKLPISHDLKGQIAENLAFNLVNDRLKDAFSNRDREFSHAYPLEALLHVKIAYPFTDIDRDKDGKVYAKTKFKLRANKGKKKPDNFNLRLHSCLCDGNKDFHLPCHMVIGALEGAFQGSTGFKTKVKWVTAGVDDRAGSFCEYNITLEEGDKKGISMKDWQKSFIKTPMERFMVL
ncbi:MAG: hypothetical protein HeimC2_16600 [Candidatus Heimdallarchaeota archaeon LC_2]|nr:MAG: hypothetical protein HeimC2_16600 [Candidatus Heimdallarchaeota archaeon LC_2]